MSKSEKKGFLAILEEGAYEAKRDANIAKRKQNEETIRVYSKAATLHTKAVAHRVLPLGNVSGASASEA